MSVVSLQKGGTVNLSKANQTISLKKGGDGVLRRVHIGLGWDMHSRVQVDLDAFIVQMGQGGNVLDTIYYGQLKSKDGSIQHKGDNLTGEGEGDDEVITIDLDRLNPQTNKLYVAVNIYQCRTTFNDIENAFIRILNQETGDELTRYDLSQESGRNYAVVFGEIVKNADGTWSFNALGVATADRNIAEVRNRVSRGLSSSYTAPTNNVPNNNQSNNQSNNNNKGFFGKLFGR